MKTFLKILDAFEEYFVIIAIGVMCVVLALQILMRYVFNHPLIWSEELARYLFVWVAFIGAGYGVRHQAHIRMEVLYKIFPPRIQKIVTLLTNTLAIAAFLYLIPSGIAFTIDQYRIASSAMGIPMSCVFVVVPIGCAIVSFRLILETLQLLRGQGGSPT